MRNKIFSICLVSIIVIIPLVIIIRPKKSMSVYENRPLITFDFNKSFVSGDLQDNIEDSLLDQMIFGTTMKKISKRVESYISESTIDTIYNNTPKNYLIPLGKGSDGKAIYRLNKSNTLVYEPLTSFDSFKDDIKKYVNIINELDNNTKNIDIYAYYINKDVDFYIYKDIVDYMRSNLNDSIKLDYLKELDDNYWDNYIDYFYGSDHHWNYKGWYAGYKDIMFLLEKDYYEYNNEKCFNDVKYSGSKAKKIGNQKYYDILCTYEFDLPNHKTYVNNKETEYGNKIEYYENKNNNDISYNHYARFFGSDYGEIKYNYNNPNAGNLLILGNSYSNPINELIASAFNYTYVIDLRAYEEDIGKEFNIYNYIAENKISKVLFIGDYNFFASRVFRFIKD